MRILRPALSAEANSGNGVLGIARKVVDYNSGSTNHTPLKEECVRQEAAAPLGASLSARELLEDMVQAW